MTRPAAAGITPGHFPGPPVTTGHVEPCPRRIRVRHGGRWVLDTLDAFYAWEHPHYPQYAVPAAGLPAALAAAARPAPDDPRLAHHVVLGLDAGDAWFEEDEQVHGHPRSPYVRVDALRSHRRVRVSLDGAVLADSPDAVVVFETGLPPRFYLDPTRVDHALLTPSGTVTRCPYKGVTSAYWHAGEVMDVAWSYGAPTLALAPVAGLVCFDDTLVRVDVDPSAG
ncbi:DUF427 domain-containing protein [Rhodococcus aerolatus]